MDWVAIAIIWMFVIFTLILHAIEGRIETLNVAFHRSFSANVIPRRVEESIGVCGESV